MRPQILITGLVISCSPALLADENGAQAVEHRGTYAKPVKRTAPRYPMLELDRRRQGWVDVNFVVTDEGKVIDPVVENSSGSHRFESAALRTVEDWLYEPATWDGEPVQQCKNKVRITFRIDNNDVAVTRNFYRKYRKISQLLDEGNLEEASTVIEDTDSNLQLNVYDISYLWLMRSEHARRTGDKDGQLSALKRAGAGNGVYLADNAYRSVLAARVALQLQLGDYSDALAGWEELEALDDDRADLSELEENVVRLREAVASNAQLQVTARIEQDPNCDGCSTSWFYEPLRRGFVIEEVQGTLENLEIRCDWHRAVDLAEAGKLWTIPENWGSCRILVFGEPGTSFKLLEPPDTQS